MAIDRDEYEGQKEVMLVISPGRIARCVSTTVESGLHPSSDTWSPSTDITLWHGDDGLLKKIEENALVFNFLSALCGELNANAPINGTFVWHALTASPAQLTSALVAVIKDES